MGRSWQQLLFGIRSNASIPGEDTREGHRRPSGWEYDGGCSPPLVSKRERTALDVKKIRKEIAPEAPFEKTAPVTTVKTSPRATM